MQKFVTRVSQNNVRDLERGLTLGYWPLRTNFAKYIVLSEDPFYEKHGTACKIQNGRRGLERGLTLGYWPLITTFAK